MTHHDFRPAFDRLANLMGWDELDDNGPPIITGPPRSIPPTRRDADTIAARNRALAALARIRRDTA